MKFPDKPTCHVVSPMFRHHESTWREPRDDEESGQKETFRSCSYCGSIHPEDLIKGLQNGAKLTGSDWKYGWPHKFYVEGLPNLRAGQMVQQFVYTNGEKSREPKYDYAAGPHVHGKWYNDHLLDEGFDDEARDLLLRALHVHTDIEFRIHEGKLQCAAPHHGYQR